ncbi:uroporphyrinogen-III decarboxylase [Candidatus Scalindua japonica]|uniref:Uroporphyrinogen-III decarboxylase n=1 Tax=Candidatus Scalindua japonica TaxID=1284222 RepID=A0A286TU19_9BACT|nr:DUF3109 family protein [Candidatus Scalindua japonica]GAX59376.1 uroporphyrinogen-III decarboxylase [Candidatus Scalindua japonica]
MSRLFPIIENIKVDLKSLISIKHTCDPEICSEKGSCCSEYEVCMEKREVDKIVTHIPEAAKFAPQLIANGTYRNIFEETDDNLVSIDTDEENQCLFAWRNGKGEALCSLHSHALKNNLSFYDTKPESCCLWPLAIYDGSPKILTVQDDAFNFDCNKRHKSEKARLDPEISSIINNVYGTKMLTGINHAISIM